MESLLGLVPFYLGVPGTDVIWEGARAAAAALVAPATTASPGHEGR